MIRIISFILFFSLVLLSCNGSKKSAKEVKATTPPQEVTPPPLPTASTTGQITSLGLKRSSCYGRCPSFVYTVQEDGSFTYEGRMHVDNLGKYEGQLPNETARELWAYAKSLDLGQYKRVYNSDIMDAPKSTLYIGRQDSVQMVIGDMKLPEPVVSIMNQLDTLSKQFPMELVEAKVPRNAIPGEIIVNLNGSTTPEEIIRSMTDYNLSLKNRVSPALSLYVLTFDAMDTNAGKLLVDLKNHDKVVEAQFNQQTDQRNNR